MKILFLSGREPSYVRNAMILKCLRKNGAEVIDCSDSSATYPARFFKVIRNFLLQKKQGFDSVFVGFFGQPLVPLVRMLCGRRIVFDAFLSSYDTMCFDRKRFRPDSPAGRFFFRLDRYSCQVADAVLLDTRAHIEYFTETFGLPREKFHRLLVGADESIFYPREKVRVEKFTVFYCSSFLPLHGAQYVIQAAALLRAEKEIEFVVVGRGMEHGKAVELAGRLGADNVRFVDWLPYRQLPLEIAQADLCLGGHFSDIDKAKRVIAGKSYQFIAMKKPVILGDCRGNRELFTDRVNALLVGMADAEALARGIVELKEDAPLRERIAEGGYRTFREQCDTAAIARELARVLGLA